MHSNSGVVVDLSACGDLCHLVVFFSNKTVGSGAQQGDSFTVSSSVQQISIATLVCWGWSVFIVCLHISPKTGPLTSLHCVFCTFWNPNASFKSTISIRSIHGLLTSVSPGWWFQIFLFSPLPGEMIQFEEHIFQMGGSTTN